MPKINSTPRTFAVIGDPIDHSLSPIIHNAAFRAQKIHAVYLPLHVKPSDLKRVLITMTMTDIEGCNVTTPHKQEIMPYLDHLDPSALRADAVNVIYCRRGKWAGANTDGSGFLKACAARRVKLAGKSVTILGAGGAASGIAAALMEAGISRLILLNRNVSRAQALRRHLLREAWMDIQTAPLTAASYRRVFPETDILIHATSAGMNGSPPLVLPIHLLPRQAVICDCQYRPRHPTALMIRAHRARHKTVDGLDLLIAQAAESYRLWLGRSAPLPAMRRAVSKFTRFG